MKTIAKVYPHCDKTGGWIMQLHSVDLVFFGGGPNFGDEIS